jgi:hypothetical protein
MKTPCDRLEKIWPFVLRSLNTWMIERGHDLPVPAQRERSSRISPKKGDRCNGRGDLILDKPLEAIVNHFIIDHKLPMLQSSSAGYVWDRRSGLPPLVYHPDEVWDEFPFIRQSLKRKSDASHPPHPASKINKKRVIVISDSEDE